MFKPDTMEGWELNKGELRPLPNTILMQYVNMKDMDLWEGDIITADYECAIETHSVKGFILYDDHTAAWCIETEDGSFPLDALDKDSIEVVGNIHENPE